MNTCVQADNEYSFINWKTATKYDLNEYETTDSMLSGIDIPLTDYVLQGQILCYI